MVFDCSKAVGVVCDCSKVIGVVCGCSMAIGVVCDSSKAAEQTIRRSECDWGIYLVCAQRKRDGQ